MARNIGANQWRVTMGSALEAFLCHSGPAIIARYNLGVEKRREDKPLIVRHAALGGIKHDFADVLELSVAGQAKLQTSPDKVAYQLKLRCLGTAKHGKAGPNCMRACGGFGYCVDHCTANVRWHNCKFIVIISASVKDVQERTWCVQVRWRPSPFSPFARAPMPTTACSRLSPSPPMP